MYSLALKSKHSLANMPMYYIDTLENAVFLIRKNRQPTKRSKKQNKAICKGKSVHRLTTKRHRAYFRKTTPFMGLNFSIGRPDHLGYIAAPRNRGRVICHQLIHHFDRKPRCTAGLRRCASPLLYTAYVSAICSILPLHPCFFGEIG